MTSTIPLKPDGSPDLEKLLDCQPWPLSFDYRLSAISGVRQGYLAALERCAKWHEGQEFMHLNVLDNMAKHFGGAMHDNTRKEMENGATIHLHSAATVRQWIKEQDNGLG